MRYYANLFTVTSTTSRTFLLLYHLIMMLKRMMMIILLLYYYLKYKIHDLRKVYNYREGVFYTFNSPNLYREKILN